MIAICNQQGAFLYNCTEEQADKRIIIKPNCGIYKKGGLDYDEFGSMRKEDGMCGWLFISQELIKRIKNIGASAIYIDIDGYFTKYGKEEFSKLDKAYRKVFEKRNEKE